MIKVPPTSTPTMYRLGDSLITSRLFEKFHSINGGSLGLPHPSPSAYRKRIRPQSVRATAWLCPTNLPTELRQHMVVQRRLDGSCSTNNVSPEATYARMAGRGHLQNRRPDRPPEYQSGVGCPACIETVVTRQFHLRRVMARSRAWVVTDRSWVKH